MGGPPGSGCLVLYLNSLMNKIKFIQKHFNLIFVLTRAACHTARARVCVLLSLTSASCWSG